jgi:ABC-2 type transport system permease protein
MAGVTGVGVNRAGGGILGREARTQYAAMARMRWRIFMNGLRSIHGLRDLGATGIAWMFYSVFGLGLGIGLCAGAYSLASSASWQYLPILFWVVSFLWLMFPIAVASFQEQSDLGTLLRFPIRFGSYFLLYLISGLMEPSTFVGVLCCLGVWLGIVIARPDLYLWAALGLSVFAVFNILLVRAVFAWIDRWLAQRKTREILGAVFMVLIVGLLAINSVWNQKRYEGTKNHKEEAAPLREALDKYAPLLRTANLVQQWLPPGLSARALQWGIEQKPVAGFASLNMLGLWVVLAGGALAGRLKAQYRGQNLSWASSRDKAIGREGGWTLGGSRPFAAIVEKELRSLMRTVPLLWAVSVPMLFVLVIAGVFHHGPSSDMNSFPYAFPLCVAYALLGFTGLFYNNLGAEGAGIQLLFLSPTPIRTVLLAKNLLHSILFVLVGFAAGVLSCLRLGVPPFVVLAATGAWLVFALPCNLAAGIIFSLTMPYRINPGRITRPAGAQANTLSAALIQLGVLGVGVLVFWLCWSLKNRWLPVPIFLALAVGALFVWMRVLHYSDDNANQRRDSLIATLMEAE